MIKVVDSIMGSGKSQFAIQHMNNDKDNNYIYITPYLDEIKRVKHSCGKKTFYEPKEDYEKNIYTKSNSLKELLKENKDIATTHSLFKIIDEETQEILNITNYTLILDEVMDVVQQIPITKADQWLLFEDAKILKVTEDNQIILGEGAKKYINEGSGKFSQLIRMAELGRLFKFEDIIILWEFPSDVFKYFKEVYILTYLFDGQIQKYFFDFYDISYNKYYVDKVNGLYELKDYCNKVNSERIAFFKEKINIYEGKYNEIGKSKTALSYNWYLKSSSDVLEVLGNYIRSYFSTQNKAKSEDCIWSTFKDFNIKVKSYQRGFIPHNIRATNEYSDTHNIAYCVNRYISPYLYKYFKSKDIEVDQDMYALSEMIQLIFRSRIRNNESINIYIPSKRMRRLMMEFLELGNSTTKN